ncbi:tetratricopeptide repeat protein [Geomonas nitrogeniifigens]|uniref:Tetratricopeptide repeat protein n=1 Tax=Geomonas diazotrophica TaxID=2843197 RepID=A0ABX8JND3_9BACT|nr:tetratricopeptide repeat protein [Geomonas nitrogeniifigens]QWV96930.1 tetratricopeptide repeat protein [Geomonas nitrogeniifigens]QXE86106.1 tetratricopeptide repeat protein [Geomonas nitrogeniifigens]
MKRLTISRPGFLLPALSLLVLAGCAIGGQAKKEPIAPPLPVAGKPVPQPSGPSVKRLGDGKEGFLIMEPSNLDGQARADFEKANELLKAGEYQKSAELMEKVIAKAPGLTAPRINAASAYSHMSKPEQAEQHLKAALEAIPGHPVAGNEYGLLLRKAGRFVEARAAYEKSLAAFPEYRPLERNLAILCDLYLKDLACAKAHYEAYSRATPDDKQVKLWIADLQTRTGQVAMSKGGGQ